MVRPEAEELTDAQVETLRVMLEDKREELNKRLKARRAGAEVDNEPGDEADQATGDAAAAMETRLMDREAKLLRLVERAIGKVEDGTYGYCEGTDEPIGFARLKLRPWTRYSVTYKEELEREEKRSANG